MRRGYGFFQQEREIVFEGDPDSLSLYLRVTLIHFRFHLHWFFWHISFCYHPAPLPSYVHTLGVGR